LNPRLQELSENTPLRLDAAVKAAFPNGGITVTGLRNEIAKGRLEVELIAGKLFTTLGAIARMRERCRVTPKERSKRDSIAVRMAPTVDAAELAVANLMALISDEPESIRMSRRPRGKSRTK
jgi:hypothetical protein